MSTTVKDQIFLHLRGHEKPLWSVGSKFKFAEGPNNYWANIQNAVVYANRVTNEVKSPYYIFQELIHSFKKSSDWKAELGDQVLQHLHLACDSVKRFQIQVRELIFEQVRLAQFPICPSRQTCIWLIANHDPNMLFYWRNEFRNAPSPLRFYRVSATGITHRVNSRFLEFNANGPKNWPSIANEYWSGVSEHSQSDEILFNGRIEVLEELALE